MNMQILKFNDELFKKIHHKKCLGLWKQKEKRFKDPMPTNNLKIHKSFKLRTYMKTAPGVDLVKMHATKRENQEAFACQIDRKSILF